MTTETTETTGTADATDPYLRRALRDVADGLKVGRLPARVVSDPALHTIEMERIFGRAWVFLGHESELAKSGDFVVRHIGGRFGDRLPGQLRPHPGAVQFLSPPWCARVPR